VGGPRAGEIGGGSSGSPRCGSGFSGTRDGTASCTEWADVRMMYDDERLYIAAHVGDPLPLHSIIDPPLQINVWERAVTWDRAKYR
jgi:hypothetical protein